MSSFCTSLGKNIRDGHQVDVKFFPYSILHLPNSVVSRVSPQVGPECLNQQMQTVYQIRGNR